MARKIEAHDSGVKRRMSKLGAILSPKLLKARKYRSSTNWKKVRKVFITDNPMCEDVFKDHRDKGTTKFSQEVHHIRQVATHYHLRNYYPNLAALCTKCHSKVSVLERQNKPTVYLFDEPRNIV